MKNLYDILKNVKYKLISGSVEIPVSGISFDSRKTKKGDLFIALKGTNTDGSKFINNALENGAVAILSEKTEKINKKNITVLETQETHFALASAASEFFDNPSGKIKIIGITGTNGKTTTATLLYKLFLKLGYKTGLISTIKNYVNKTEINAEYTTPDALTFNMLLKKMIDAGCEYCFTEVSSHAIHQKRIECIKFSGGIFTNITHDHLDYHKTFKEYLKTKKQFFDNLPENAFALANTDDKNGKIILQNTKAQKYTYGLKNFADFKSKIFEMHPDGMLMSINNTEFWTLLTGKFNACNITAVFATAVLLKQNTKKTITALSSLKPVKGRLDTVKINDITAVVDYAHTPDAIKNLLNTINEIKSKNQKVITIIGAGGNRDKSKRPEMAKTAEENSDILILTSDNPRNENPDDIIADMMTGITNKSKVINITDRKNAIKTSVMLARKGDIIVIAGKGHENYQIIKEKKYHFDDKEIITELLNNLTKN